MITLHDIFIGDFRISQKFGNDLVINGVHIYKKMGLLGHDGVDWATPTGTKLISPVNGTIISVKYDKGGYGTHVKILDWGQRCCVLMAHMKSVNVRLWQTVKVGQLIGLSNNTGNSTGPHLHFGLCQTNMLGYRINTKNGYLGWINCLSSKLVKWIVSNPTSPLKV